LLVVFVWVQAGGLFCRVYVLRARNRSSDRTAIAFTRRTETGVGVLACECPGPNGLGDEVDVPWKRPPKEKRRVAILFCCFGFGLSASRMSAC
jgi:hypothetical protein